MIPPARPFRQDGSLLVGDDTNGVIYQMSYAEAENATGNDTTAG